MFRSLLCGMLPPDRKSPISSFPPPSIRHSRYPLPSFPRRRESGRALLPRLPRRPGAEDRRACGDQEATSKEEQQQQDAGYASAAGSGELVRWNGRRCTRGRRSGDGRASWGHRWRWCGSGRPGRYDVIRTHVIPTMSYAPTSFPQRTHVIPAKAGIYRPASSAYK